MSWLKRNIVMLPTDEEAKLSLFNGELIISPFVNWESKSKDWEKGDGVNQHLYIISDEKIEDGDWYLFWLDDKWELMQCRDSEESDRCNNHPSIKNSCKKIIATTDKTLTTCQCGKVGYHKLSCKQTYNLPQPSQQFIEKYIEEYNKGNVITEVMVEYEELWKSTVYDQPDNYIGEALKVNLKDNTINIMLIKDSWNWKELKALFDSYGDNHAAQIIWNDIQNL